MDDQHSKRKTVFFEERNFRIKAYWKMNKKVISESLKGLNREARFIELIQWKSEIQNKATGDALHYAQMMHGFPSAYKTLGIMTVKK